MTTTIGQNLRAPLDGFSEAWKNGDGVALAQCCTEDVDFINILGMHVKGRAAVAELHNKILSGPYKDSTVTLTIESVRTIAPNAVLVVTPALVDIPAGPVKGTVSTVASILFARTGDQWKIAHFQNTRREATQLDHIAIMADAVKD